MAEDTPPHIDGIIERARTYLPDLNAVRLEEAYSFAETAHAGQLRESGEPYIVHPLATTRFLTEIRADEDTLIAGLLHDIPDGDVKTVEEIRAAFGSSVAELVEGIVNIAKVKYRDDMETQQLESLRKMVVVLAKDVRVILIRLAERLHNMETLIHLTPEKRVRIAKETLEVYAPLAHRLGMSQMKAKLEDLAFQHLHPIDFERLRARIAETHETREAYIEDVRRKLSEELGAIGLADFSISGRTKNLYSIYKKMDLQRKPFEEIYDVFALRVVVPSVKDCYAVLGVIHDLWKPKPGEFDDYIAVPKSNGYQSLHTTVFAVNGRLTEIQIRTKKMHEDAEFGSQAHWAYATAKRERARPSVNVTEKEAGWVKSLHELGEGARDSREFMENLRLNLFQDHIFVFTPRGDVKELPAGATVLDFAYAVHTELGHMTVGVKVNGAIAPLSTQLHTGDVVEVITAKNTPGPKRDWLALVKTHQARTKIRVWFKSLDRTKNLEIGRSILQHEFDRMNRGSVDRIPADRAAILIDALSAQSLDDVFTAIGEGTFSPLQVMKLLFRPDELLRELPVRKRGSDSTPIQPRILIQGTAGMITRIARCCSPAPGQKILGFVTRMQSITIHRVDCPAVRKLAPERLIHAAWDTGRKNRRFLATVRIVANERPGISRDLLLALAELNVEVHKLEAVKNENGVQEHALEVEVETLDELDRLYQRLELVEGVTEVRQRD